ncbi:MAG: DNA integrity scanning protein DisA nucleotide-binding domain protein [Nanoarchaeota archaeon]|nr:DNA integrity scanning protein DisA nucleotide-binding domain protein [Nanoarchaeota archaeon]
MVKENNSPKNVEQVVIESAIELAKKGEGALFVIGEDLKYEKLLNQEFKPFSVLNEGARKLLVGLAMIDGAIIITKEGMVVEYGVLIKNSRAFLGYGTRHAAAVTASKKGNTAILCSEEERKVKIFRDGKYIMKIDALEKGIEKKTKRIVTMLETIGAGFVGVIGVATIAPTIGIALIPGVVIFGGSYYAVKRILKLFSHK